MHSQTVPLPQDNTLTRHRPSLGALTGMRFFLAAYVLLHHTRVGTYLVSRHHEAAATFFFNGQIAVAQFFLLSGFILAYTYSGQIESSRQRLRFWQARFARIWPVYVLSLVLSSLVMHSTPSVPLIAATLLMVQGWNPAQVHLAGVWNPVCWTLTVEALFYLVFPWLQRALEGLRRHMLTIVSVLTMVVLLVCNTAPKGPGHPGYSGVFVYVPYPVIHLPEFVLGVALGNTFLQRGRVERGAGGGWLTYAGLVLAVAMLVLPLSHATSVVMVGFAMLTYGLVTEKTVLARMLATRTMLLGGGLSYSMYLLQTPIRDAIDPLFMRSSQAMALVGKVVLFPALVLIPLVVFLYFEEPARRWLRRAFEAIDQRSVRRAASSRG